MNDTPSSATVATTMSVRRAVTGATGLLVLASIVDTALVAARVRRTGNLHYGFLTWNLVLAWVPYLLSIGLLALHRHRSSGWMLLLIALPWLAFLPNAPYIVTDFVHVGGPSAMPLWFDATLVGTHAATGLALGLVSLLLVHHVAAQRLGTTAGWLLSAGALVLTSVGIYLGRVHRFNSWDTLANPGPLLSLVTYRLTHPLGNPRLLVALAVMVVCLGAAYTLLWCTAVRWQRRHTLPQ